MGAAMPRKHELEFANFVCKFGMRDMDAGLATMLLPALLEYETIESRGGEYHFFGARLLDDAHDGVTDHLVALQFARPKTLRGDIVLRSRRIEHSATNVEIAGSGIVVLMLESHRMIYLPETLHAPSLSQFRTAVLMAVRHVRESLIDAQVKEYEDEDQPEARRVIAPKYPPAALEIVPLAGEEEVSTAIKRFEKLKKVSIRLMPKNAEIDNDHLFAAIEDQRIEVGSDDTELIHRNRKGLDPKVARRAVVSAGKQGTAHIKLSGTDKQGKPIRVVDDEITFRVPVTFPIDSVTKAARLMVKEFRTQLANANIGAPNLDPGFAQRVRAAIAEYRAARED